MATRLGLGLHDRVLSRDDAHLTPLSLTRAAAQRLKAGIRALEAYLRRLIVYLALQIEPDLPQDRTEVPLYHRPRATRAPGFRFRSFERTGPPLSLVFPGCDMARHGQAKGLIPADPLLSRLRHLKALLEAPDKRARRLAFHLARKRPGLIAPPGFAARFRSRYGTEISALYDSLGPAILDASRARPPPLGPVPRPGPRITRL